MKNITITVAEQDLSFLKQNKYALCFACRDRELGYDVICRADMNYMGNTTIGFGNEYQIFCCQSVTNRETLVLSTNLVNIALGQQITLNEAGTFSSPVGEGSGESITLNNDYGNIYPGYSRKISYGGSEAFLPVFVAPYASVKGTYTMCPRDVVQIWFEQFAKSQIFLKDFLIQEKGIGRSSLAEAALTDGGVQLLYQNGNWQK